MKQISDFLFKTDSGTPTVHNFYMVVFLDAGIGTSLYLMAESTLKWNVDICLMKNIPFHVGHEHRMTLTDGTAQFVAKIMHDYRSGIHLGVIAQNHSITLSTVRYILEKEGIVNPL